MSDVSIPDDLGYTKEDEWTRRDGNIVAVGITDYAQDQLGDIVFVELPAVGDAVTAGETFGTIESVKAVSDLFSPVTGTVTEVNGELGDKPELVNEDCYGGGWMLKVELAAGVEPDLLDAAAYRASIAERE